MAIVLGSANLGSLVFLVFYGDSVKRDPFATKFCAQCRRQYKLMLEI